MSRQAGLDRPQPVPHELDAVAIRAHLGQILTSSHFKNSRRCQSLLKYVVEAACEGRADDLKERVVGSSVFGREVDYDTNQDAVVRNAAAEVRKRLAQYYMETESGDALRIELPIGSYVPDIRTVTSAIAVRPAAGVRRFNWIHGAIAASVLAIVAVAHFASRSGPLLKTDLDRLWEPLISNQGILQVCVGQSRLLYYPGPLPLTPEGQVDTQAHVPVAVMKPMRDRFMHTGDAICLSKVTGYLQAAGKPFRFRGALNTPYAELRGLPIVLIGAFNNEWNIRLTRNLRFSLLNEPHAFSVVDRQNPLKPAFVISRAGVSDWDVDMDYALVTRMYDPSTESWVIAAGGFTAFGTMLAGDFISHPAYFREALRSAPPGWETKNMQIVLKAKVVEGTPGPPEVVASHFW